MIFNKVKQILQDVANGLAIVVVSPVLLSDWIKQRQEMKKEEQEIERKRKEVYVFRLKKLKIYNRLIETIDPNLIAIIEPNSALNNLLAIELLQTQLEWTKEQAITKLITIHLLRRSNQEESTSYTNGRKLRIPFGELILMFNLFSYDTGELRAMIYEMEFDVKLRNKNEVFYEQRIELGTTLGSNITPNLFEGFVLQQLSLIVTDLGKHL